MIVPDVNVLIYAYNSTWQHHADLRAWWEDTLSGSRNVGLAWVAVLGFIRIMTHARLIENPLKPAEACWEVRRWLGNPQVQILIPGTEHAEILFGFLEQLGAAGNLTTDAHLAALAIEYRAELASTDTDFARFPKLRWFNPLRARR